MAGSGHGVLSTVHLESKANDWKSVSPKELRLFEVHANTMGAEEGEELEPHEGKFTLKLCCMNPMS